MVGVSANVPFSVKLTIKLETCVLKSAIVTVSTIPKKKLSISELKSFIVTFSDTDAK